jgi:hypothetical protein
MAASIKVSKILTDKVRLILQDTGKVRWTDAELVDWLNEAQRVIAEVKPNATAATSNVSLVAGTKQSITGIALLDAIRNMGADGLTPGSTIRCLKRDVLDTIIPGWHTEPAAAQVLIAAFDEQDQKVFYVFPPQPVNTAQKIEVIQSEYPAVIDVANITTAAISVDDIYEAQLVDYVCYRAFDKDSSIPSSTSLSQSHFQAFASALGIKSKAEVVNSPNMPAQPPAPQQ